MLAIIAGQTAGPNGLIFFEGTNGYPGVGGNTWVPGGGQHGLKKILVRQQFFFIKKQIKEIKKLNLNNCLEVQAERS